MEPSKTEKLQVIKNWLGSGSINIFGLPFSGKDTHGSELATFFEAPLIGGGDIIRASEEHELKSHIATGALAPTDKYLALVLPYFEQVKYDGKPLILSSVGRWQGEEKSVLQAAEESDHPIKAVIYLDVEETEIIRRWKNSERQRHDDTSEVILNKRFDEFKSKTIPVIDYYRSLGCLIEVDGTPPIQSVTDEIINQLYMLATTPKG